jgi:hypothetical protein
VRVLSLSHRLPGILIDNHTILNAPALFDYDTIVWDIGAVMKTIREAAQGEGEFFTFADRAVVNGANVEGAAGLAMLLQRRRDEVQRALERGATLVVYAFPPTHFSGIAGFQGLDSYWAIPAPDGLAWDAVTLPAGEGVQAAVVDHGHPFVPVLETYRRDLLYRVYFNDRALGFARNARVFLRSAGGAPIGVEFSVLNGRVVFMPPPRIAGEDWFASDEGAAIVRAVEDLLGTSSANAPYWVSDLAVPGLDDRAAALDRARSAVEAAQSALEAAQADHAERAAIRDVVWAPGDASLLAAALACAEALGFERGLTPDGQPVLLDGDTQVHLVAAASTEAVGMSAHYRLRQYLDKVIADRAIAPRGLIIANGQCMSSPDERQREIEDSLRVAAEATRYAVLPARALFAAAVFALEGTSEETLTAIRSRILGTDGIVALGDLVPSLAPAPADAPEDDAPTM